MKDKIKCCLFIKNKKYDSTAKIIIGQIKKCGTGFNDPELNMLILATDCKDVRQREGRIRQVGGIIYDFVDDMKTFENHWKLREEWYLQRGAHVVYK